MPDKIKADIKFANFEYQGWFSEPIFEPVRLFGSIGAVYTALKPLNISASDVKYQSGASTPTDTLVSLQLAKKNYTVNLALAGFSFKADFVDWSQAPIISEIIENTAKALNDNLKNTMGAHQLQINMQVVLPGVSMKEFTRSFLPLIKRPAGDVEFNGFILHTKTGVFLVDKSVIHEEGMYVRITRKFDGKANIAEMSKALYNEEAWLAASLGIEMEGIEMQ